MAAAEPASWERLPGETQKQWAAFQAYRDLPAKRRTVPAAVEALMGRPCGVRGGPSRWRQWASDNAWASRAAAWDAEVDRRGQAEFVRERKKAIQAQATAYRSALSTGLEGLRLKRDSLGAGGLSEATLVRLLDLGAAGLGRVYGTVPDQTVEVRSSALSPEEAEARRAQIRSMIEAALPPDDPGQEIPVGDTGRD